MKHINYLHKGMILVAYIKLTQFSVNEIKA